MSELKVLTLVHPQCVPPDKATVTQADWAQWKTEFYVKKTLKKLGHKVRFYGVSDDLGELKQAIDDFAPDIVFNLLEEFKGEPSFESHVVSFLELMGIPYTGCNPQGLAMGRDKALTKKILSYHGIKTAQFFTVDKGMKAPKEHNLRFPLIVKSTSEEASLGISQESIVHKQETLQKRVEFIHTTIDTGALVEEYIEGRELYVGVLGNKRVEVFAPWELHFGDLPKNSYPIATRNVKFSKKYCDKHEIRRGPALGISQRVANQIDELCRETYSALKMNGYARIDLRLKDNSEIYLLEVNPNAELANRECLANAALHSGMSYDRLIAKILSLGLSYQKAA